jgi:murein DD-endopeptidase MepM/ murein hydrolase activator NlpD
MAQHMLLLAAVRSKTVRRIVGGVVAFVLIMILGIVVPLVAVPMMVAGASTGQGGAQPTVVGEWGYPLAGDYRKTDGYGPRSVPDCSFCSTFHRGYDMAQDCGATIYAAGPGTVIRAGAWGTFGNAVQIDHGGGVATIYGHMMWNSLMVQTGTTVVAGTPIGLEGRTGAATGCHLHLEVRVNGVAIDPEPFMAARGLPLK